MATVSNGLVASTVSSTVHVSQITIRHCDVFRRFGKLHMVKMSPYVEVSLGDRIIGTVPPAIRADLKPVWNYTMLTQGFDASQELKLRVLDKHTWPRKDVVIGVGSVRLPEEYLSGNDKQIVEQTIKLFKKHHGEERPELTGNISISLNILRSVVPPTPPNTKGVATASEEPGFQTRVSSTAANASTQSRSSTTGSAQSPLIRGSDAETNTRETAPNGVVVWGPSLLDTAEASDEHLQLVTRHYFGRNVREERRRPVFCTSGICELLRTGSCRRKCCGCCTCVGGCALVAIWALGFI